MHHYAMGRETSPSQVALPPPPPSISGTVRGRPPSYEATPLYDELAGDAHPTGMHSCFSMLLEEEMRTLEPHPQTLHGCHVVLKYLEETLGDLYSGCHSNIISYHLLPWDPLLVCINFVSLTTRSGQIYMLIVSCAVS